MSSAALHDAADPLRLHDLRFGFSRDAATSSRFEARLKLGAAALFGAEVRGERLGASFETQRLALGLTEERGRLDLEGAFRAPRWLLRVDASKRRDETWTLLGDGALRLNDDWEVLLRYQYDTDGSRGGPPSLETFIESGRLPPAGRMGRALRTGALGLRYQHANDLELDLEGAWSRFRTEAGFDQDRARLEGGGVWSASGVELDGRASYARVSGRLARSEAFAELGGSVRLGGHVVASGRTLQEWQPGVERFIRDYRAGVTFFGRRFRFARQSPIGRDVLRLARRANALGYNERRVYDLEGVRELRERLGLSPRRDELAPVLEALYSAQVAERNVPQLGLEVSLGADELAGRESRGIHVFLGVPWRPSWLFATGEGRVEFLRLRYELVADRFSALPRAARSHRASLAIELDREHVLLVRWESPGQTPLQRAFGLRPGQSVSVDYAYTLGR